MISAAFHAVIYNPIYNGLIFAVNHLPTHDVGIAVIIITIVVRVIIFPLSKRAVETQIAMKAVTPAIEELKKKHPERANREQAIKLLDTMQSLTGIVVKKIEKDKKSGKLKSTLN